MLLRISNLISKINRQIGESLSWISLLLILLICIDVMFRYLFDATQTWIIELEWHLFAMLFLLAAASTFEKDEHVRVDLYYNRYGRKHQLWFDLILTALLLLPWCLVIIKTGFNYGLNSYYMNESSPNPGGLPARYIIKFVISIGFVFLLFQAVAKIFENIHKLINRDY